MNGRVHHIYQYILGLTTSFPEEKGGKFQFKFIKKPKQTNTHTNEQTKTNKPHPNPNRAFLVKTEYSLAHSIFTVGVYYSNPKWTHLSILFQYCLSHKTHYSYIHVHWWKEAQKKRFFPSILFSISLIIVKFKHVSSRGGTHMLRHTGMCHPNGLLSHQKSLNMGPILVKKILRGGSHLTKIPPKIVKSAVFEPEKPL